jgi:hypothetical protein
MQTTKKCFKCGQVKIITDFYPHKQMGDGYLNKCKECTKKDIKLYRIEHPDILSKYELKRSKSQKRIAYSKKHYDLWIKRNPEKYKAHYLLSNAVRDKRIIKPDLCEICGNKTRLHGHHTDYAKPLEVIWLCAKCHGQIQ